MVASVLFFATPLAQAAMYAPGETLNPDCGPTDPDCGVTTSVATGLANQVPYYAADGNILSATSTFQILSNGTASTTNLVVGNSLTIGTLSGFLKSTAGAVATALVNLASDVTGILPVGSGGTGVAAIASGFIPFGNGTGAVATSSAFYFDSANGRLGIGTTTPGAVLDVYGGMLRVGAGYAGGSAGDFSIGRNTSGYMYFGSLGSAYLGFNGSEFGFAGGGLAINAGNFRLDSGIITQTGAGNNTFAGNVGIGTTSPSALFSLHGNSYISGTSFFGGAITATSTLNVTGLTTLGNASTTQIGSTGSAYFATAGGNVGVGTTRPLAKLDVVAGGSAANIIGVDARVSNTTAAGSNARLGIQSGSSGTAFLDFGDSDNFLGGVRYYNATDSMGLNVNGSDRVTILSSGNVGIGTTSPSSYAYAPNLVVNGGSNDGGITILNGTSGAGRLHFADGMGNDAFRGIVQYNHANDSMQFATAGNYKMIIDSTGNVGIGSTTPWGALSVTSSSNSRSGFILDQASNTFGDPAMLLLQRSAIGAAAPVITAGGPAALDIESNRGAENNNTKGLYVGMNFAVNSSATSYSKYAGQFALNDTGTTNTNLTSYYGLHSTVTSTNANSTVYGVYANASGNGTAYGIYSAAGTNYFNSNVGIGTTTPNVPLQISANPTNELLNIYRERTDFGGVSQSMLVLQGKDTTALNANEGVKVEFKMGDNSNLYTYGEIKAFRSDGADARSSLSFHTLNSGTSQEQMRINYLGNVGIGTTTPWKTLSVAGTVAFNGLTGTTGAGSICLSADKELVYNAGSDNCLSSLRTTKHDIIELTLSGTSTIAGLQPVSFIYNNDASGTVRYGFIAEDAAGVDPHLGTYDASGRLSGVDDRSLLSVVVKAIQELAGQVSSLAATIAGFADSLVTKKVETNELCVDGTCITGDQLKEILTQTGQIASPIIITDVPPPLDATSTPPADTSATSTATTTEPESATTTPDTVATPDTLPSTDSTSSSQSESASSSQEGTASTDDSATTVTPAVESGSPDPGVSGDAGTTNQ